MIDIKDYEGLYFASPQGQIHRVASKKRLVSRILKPFKLKTGYLVVELCKKGIRKKFLVHRLVAKAYLNNFDNKPQVNHLNGVKDDNRASNLEWVTSSENQKHAIETGLRSAKGVKNSQSKLTESDVIEIRQHYDKKDTSLNTIAVLYGVSVSTICQVGKRTAWSHIN